MTTIFNTIPELRNQLRPLRPTKQIALVPTMGNLHEGHISLIQKAKEQADIVIASIFVNPTQFGEGEDFASYPKTLEADLEKLSAVNTNFVFAPTIEQMYQDYPKLPATAVNLGDMAVHLCGKSRPGHFDGVGLVVSKLFNIVQPDVAIFGKKDYQQLALISQMAHDLSYPIDIIGGDIVRAEDGLALSSRNQYLTTLERTIAPHLNATICELGKSLARGEHLVVGFNELVSKATKTLNAIEFNVDYLQIRTRQLTDPTIEDKELVILVAVWLGKARLLDNLEVTVKI